MPPVRRLVGAPTNVPELWPHRLLRQLSEPSCHRPLPVVGPPADPVVRARRGLVGVPPRRSLLREGGRGPAAAALRTGGGKQSRRKRERSPGEAKASRYLTRVGLPDHPDPGPYRRLAEADPEWFRLVSKADE